MIGKNNHYLRDTKDGTKVESYSIKKFKVGAASVVIGASIFLGAGAVAQASEEVSNNTTADNTTNAGDKENVPTAPVATAQPVAKETTKEDVAAGLAAKLGGEVKALDKTKLESYIAEIEAKLADGTYANKTEESVAVLKADLDSAKETLANAKTQDEITKAYSKLVTTVNTKLKAKPVEKKETLAVDTTNGKETVGKKAENTEKKSESNSIENTGSKDPRNGKALDKNNAFRAETTETSGNFNYSMEYSNGKKEIYLYNEEEADVDIKVSSTAGNITKATVKAGSGQFVLKSKSDQAIAYAKGQGGVNPQEEEVEIDGYGWSYRQTLTETQGPVTIKITGQPNDEFKKIPTYTKTENQEAVLGSRFLQLEDSTGAKLPGGRGASDPGYFRLVVKSQTYKYDIQLPESNADKIAVSNVDSPTEADITKIKNELKIKYSDKATTEDARLASKRGEVVNPRSSVVKEIAVANGTVTVTYNDDSVDTAPVSSVARTNVAPTVSIPYSDPTPDKKDIYIYNGEEVDIDITFNDDSGKIQSASLKRGGNIALRDIGENKQDNEWGLVTTVIKNETTTPATIKITGTVTGLSDNKIPKTESQELPIVSRFATATDLDGAFIENQATKFNAGTNVVSESYKTDPGAFTITLKAQTAKYDIKTPASADKVTVSDANNISNEDFEKIKAKVKIEYSNNNIDMRLADKKGEVVDNQTERIESIEREGNNVVVTYKDGSKDTKALADFVNVAPKVALPYSNEANKQIYVYTGENTDLTFKGTDENEVKDLYLRGPGDITWNNANPFGFTTGKVENGTVTGEGSVSEDKRTATIKMTGKTNLPAGQQWTSFIVSKDNDGKLSNTDYRALDKDPNARQKPGYAHFLVKNQTFKYDIAAPTEKVAVTDPANVTQDELDKIKEKLQIEYSKRNDDANLAEKKGKAVDAEDAKTKIKSVEKDANGNLVVTYTDGSKDTRSLSEFVTLDKQPAIEAVEKAAEAKIDEINKTPNATDDEKQAAIDKVNADKKKALDEIAKPEVTTKEALTTAKDSGTTAIAGDNPVVAKKDAAKADVETARKAKEDAIKANPNLTQAEKDAAIAKNNTAAAEATKAIDSATTDAAVDTAKTAGTGEIAKVNPVAKEAAKKAVADELAEKEKAIDGRTDLTDAEKAAAKKDAQDKAKEATDAINAQPDNAETPEKATEAQTAVDGAKDKGVADVKAVNPVAKAAAKKAVADELAEKEKAIDARTDLTDAEKTAAKDDAKAKAKAATDAIDAQPSNAATPEEAATAQTAVNGAKDKGVADVKAVNPVAKAAAKKAIADELAKKEKAIDGRTDLTDEEKAAAKKDAQDKAKEATDAIDAQPSNAATPEEAEKAQTAVNGAKDKGVADVKAVDPAAAKKPEAKKAVDDALKAKVDAIDAREDLTPAEKQAAKDKAAEEAKKAKEAIDAATTDAAVDTAKTAGTGEIAKVNPVAKTKAKEEIAKELAKKEEAIDGRTDLTDAEKAKAKEDAKAKAKEATDAINAQPDNAETPDKATEAQTAVNDAKDKGVADVKAVNPVAKEAAKKAIADELAKKEEAIDGRTDLTDEEKAAAKKDAQDKAKEATDAINAQPDSVATPEEAAKAKTAVDGAKDKGVADVKAVNPVAKAKPEAKKAIDDKLAKQLEDIANTPDATDEEKKVAAEAAKALADQAKKDIDNAKKDEDVKKLQDEAKEEIEKSVPVVEDKPNARKAIEDEAKAKKAAIDARTDLTPKAKEDLKAEVDAIADQAKKAVDKATSATDVDKIEEADKAAIKAVGEVKEPVDKTLVKDPANLTDAEKAKLLEEVKKVNPTAKEVKYDEDGNIEVTTQNGDKGTIKPADIVKTENDLDNGKGGNDINKPIDKVIVKDPANLTDADKAKIVDEVKAVNPNSIVTIDDKGTVTVSTPDGETAAIPAAELVRTKEDTTKPDAGNSKVVKPADKVVGEATDPAAQAKVEEKLKDLNPTAKSVKFDEKGNATVTLNDGTTATIPAKDLFKSPEEAAQPNAGNDIVKPADKAVVKDPANLTDAEKKAIEDKVKAVNPGATVVVDDKGNATVTTPEGKTAVIPATDLTKSPEEAAQPNAGNDIVKPADKTVAANPEKLTDAEKKAIEDKVKAVNPGATVAVDDKGNATVTTPEGKTAVIPATDLVKSPEEATKPNAGNDIVKPADKTVAANPDKLTDAEKKAIEDKVKAVNPGATVAVDDKGNATVTTPEGKTAVVPATDLVKSPEEATKPNAGNDINTPAGKVEVKDPAKLTDEEKAKVKKAVEDVNPGSKVVVDAKGNATVTTPEGKTAVVPAADVTKSAADADKANAGNVVNTPAGKVEVKDPAKLTDEEKAKVKKAVEDVNPGSKVVVDDKGNATVTTPEGKTAVVPAADVTKSAADADKANAGNAVNTPAGKVEVKNPANLTDEEKAKVKKAVEDVNPGSKVVVDDKGNATVTTPEGKTATIPGADVTKSAADAGKANAGNVVNTPAIRVLVGDKAKLTADEIEKVKESVKAVNPGSTVVVDDKGNATVTTPEGKTATIPAAQLVKDAKDVAAKNNGDNINLDFEKETVVDFNNLTDAEKEAAKAKIKGANADVEEVIFDKAGNATVITKEGKVYTIAAKDIFKQRLYVPSNGGGNNGATNTDAKVDKAKLEGAIRQLDELIIKESAKLDAETAKEATALLSEAKAVFANAKASQAEVDAMVKRIEDFMAKVVSSTDHATPANDQDAQTPATAQAAANARKVAKELPNTGTADSTVAMVAAAASALLGFGLAGRRRKEDEEA